MLIQCLSYQMLKHHRIQNRLGSRWIFLNYAKVSAQSNKQVTVVTFRNWSERLPFFEGLWSSEVNSELWLPNRTSELWLPNGYSRLPPPFELVNQWGKFSSKFSEDIIRSDLHSGFTISCTVFSFTSASIERNSVATEGVTLVTLAWSFLAGLPLLTY